MSWLALLVALLKVVVGLTDYLRQKELIDAAQAAFLKANTEASLAAIDKANAARKAATDRFDAAGGVPDDTDPNLRD